MLLPRTQKFLFGFLLFEELAGRPPNMTLEPGLGLCVCDCVNKLEVYFYKKRQSRAGAVVPHSYGVPVSFHLSASLMLVFTLRVSSQSSISG